MITTREPYELLVRWVPAGVPENQYAGTVQAQINFAFVVRDDSDAVVSWTPDPKGPFPVALSGNNGIALSDFMPQLNSTTLEALAIERTKVRKLEALATEPTKAQELGQGVEE